jgi:hypothetical protein
VRVTTVEIVPHSFYVMVVQKESKTTIMLDPLTDPEKTVGVKMTLAAIATRILQLAGMEIGNVQRTNIGEYLNMVQNILKP